MTKAIESLHRSVISELNKPRGGYNLVYYKDVVIESAILPLVKLLNNEWSLTTHSCGGHWGTGPKFQYPYVSFYVFKHRSEWQNIVKNTWRDLKPKIGSKLTIQVEDDYKLPELLPMWSCWRFCPNIKLASRKPRDIFKNGKAFRQELDLLIGKTFSVLKIEIDRRKT
jgi:hypothetical protein